MSSVRPGLTIRGRPRCARPRERSEAAGRTASPPLRQASGGGAAVRGPAPAAALGRLAFGPPVPQDNGPSAGGDDWLTVMVWLVQRRLQVRRHRRRRTPGPRGRSDPRQLPRRRRGVRAHRGRPRQPGAPRSGRRPGVGARLDRRVRRRRRSRHRLRAVGGRQAHRRADDDVVRTGTVPASHRTERPQRLVHRPTGPGHRPRPRRRTRAAADGRRPLRRTPPQAPRSRGGPANAGPPRPVGTDRADADVELVVGHNRDEFRPTCTN